jgi:hypothetical protein
MGVRSRSRVSGAQFGLAISSSVITLTPPAIATGAMAAEMFVRTGSVNFTREGTDPSTTRGFTAYPDEIIKLNSRDELDRFKAIRATSTDATLDIEYWTDISG